MKCINCGAPRNDSQGASANCGYCGGLSVISLSYESSFFDSNMKNSIRDRIENDDSYADDPEAQVSLIILYLLDDLFEMSAMLIGDLCKTSPREPKYIILKAVTILSERGIKKSKIKTIEEASSLLNLAAAFSSESELGDISELASMIKTAYYETNGINPNAKLLGLLDNVGERSHKNESLMGSILLN